MSRFEETVIQRECELVQIPDGHLITVDAGTPAVITQSLGDTYTLQLPTLGGLYRLQAKDADAIGKQVPLSSEEAAAAAAGPLDEKLVWDSLRNVYDPEIPVNIVELGLVYDLKVMPLDGGGNRVDVKMQLTAEG